MSDETKAIFAQIQLAEAERTIVYLRTAICNALTELEDGDIDEAIATLKQFA